MKQQGSFYLPLLSVFLLFLFLSGCHTGRLSHTQRTERNMSSNQVVTRLDSLSLLQQIQANCNKRIYLEKIEYSPPDSLARQYVQSVTSAAISSDVEQLAIVSNEMKKEEHLLTLEEEKQEISKVTSASYYCWMGVLAGVILCVLVMRGYVKSK